MGPFFCPFLITCVLLFSHYASLYVIIGTSHFFREHGRLQNQAAKRRSIESHSPIKRNQDNYTTTSEYNDSHRKTGSGNNTGKGITTIGGHNNDDDGSKYVHNMKAKVAANASSLIEHELKQGEDHGVSYEAMRADRQERLKNILNNVVYTARVIDKQLEYIKAVGWNKYND
jgi:hypothetical protein